MTYACALRENAKDQEQNSLSSRRAYLDGAGGGKNEWRVSRQEQRCYRDEESMENQYVAKPTQPKSRCSRAGASRTPSGLSVIDFRDRPMHGMSEVRGIKDKHRYHIV